MRKRQFYAEWLTAAFPKAWAIAETSATILGLVSLYLVKRYPQWEAVLTDLGWQIPLGIVLAVLILRLAWAPYVLTRERERTIRDLRKELEGDLTIDLEEGFFGEGEIRTPLGERAEGTFLFMVAIVRNTGEPVALDGFRCGLVIYGGDGVTRWGQKQGIPKEYAEITGPHGVLQTFAPEDDIRDRTRRPIEKGGFERGKAIYFFPGVSRTFAEQPKTKIIFEARDVRGRIRTAEKHRGDLSARPMLNYPGLRQTTSAPAPSTMTVVVSRLDVSEPGNADVSSGGTQRTDDKKSE